MLIMPEDPQKLIDLCLEIEEVYPWLMYGYNLLYTSNNKIMVINYKNERVIYAPFCYKGQKIDIC